MGNAIRSFMRVALFAAGLMAWIGLDSLPVEADSPDAQQSAVEATKPVFGGRKQSPSQLYAKQIAPLLAAKCGRCHGEKTQKSELNLGSPAGIQMGSESGPVIEPGKPDESLLFELVHDGEMPPDEDDRLSPEEVEILRAWIASGAVFPTTAAVDEQITQLAIVPIMHLRCTACHGPRRREAGLDLRTQQSMLKGGKSGPAIVPGDPDGSLVLKRIHAGEMPPARDLVSVSIKPIEPQEVELLSRWIAAGAPVVTLEPDVAGATRDPLVSNEDRDFWAFQPPKPVAIPAVSNSSLVRNPIDAFIEQKLEQNDLSLSTEAHGAVLARRAAISLTGLPPEPFEMQRFAADSEPAAYDRLIDRLLASPRFGERWARFWLDLAGYSDSEGIQHADIIRPHVYRYRDYVIRAFNSDKPYDRFLLEQLAGDELVDYEHLDAISEDVADNLIATAFLRMAPDGTYSNITGFVPDRLKVIEQEIEIVGSAVMGLTLKCARCHSHKFDPIPQRDYYRLAAVFKGAYDEHDWLVPSRQSGAPGTKDRYLPHVPSDERAAWESNQSRIDEAVNGLNAALKKREEELIRQHLAEQMALLPTELHDDVGEMLETPAEKRSEIQSYLAEKFEKTLRIDAEQLKKKRADFKELSERTERQIKSFESQRTPEPLIRALWDRGEPTPTFILKRGNYRTPSRLVGPGVVSVLTDGSTPFDVAPPWSDAKKTGRRLAFARWLIHPDHPLTARVIVNRIWKQHFGMGIVKTLDNFGKAGTLPSHPELLDWLTLEFIQHGWSLKWLHRTIVTSATFRQLSATTPERLSIDPENRLLSRMPLGRLDAETIRDALLFTAGRLNETPFGPADQVDARADGLVTSVGSENGRRRSIYVLQRRTQIPTLLQNFDLPSMNPNCIERPISIVAPQALHLMNNGLVHELSSDFARRVMRETDSSPAAAIERAYRLALSRPPTAAERWLALKAFEQLREHWAKELNKQNEGQQDAKSEDRNVSGTDAAHHAMANICHAIFNSAEFLYVD